jgi:hypothetical protein
MSEDGRRLWERVAEPSENRVHFTGIGLCDSVTLCGRPDWLQCSKGDGEPTKAAVNCPGCLAIVRHVLNRGLPRELRS